MEHIYALVNGTQFLNAASLLLLSGSTPGGGTAAIVVVPLKSIYGSL